VLYSRLHIGSAQRFPEARRLTAEDIEALDMLTELADDPELRLARCQVNLSRSEKAEAGCAITLPPPHSAIRSPPRIGRSAASIARRDGVEG
jgi:hypothetical protein